MKISTYIFELLQSQDCVIVPNFGAFVARNISAKISSDGSKIFPPNKELSFNKNVVKNDGLLLNAIASNENINYEVAEQKILCLKKNDCVIGREKKKIYIGKKITVSKG